MQAAVSQRPERHADRGPGVLEVAQRRRHPGIGEREVPLRPGIEGRLVAQAIDVAVPEAHRLVDLRVIDRVLPVFRRRPGEHEEVVALARRGLRRRPRGDLLDGDVIDDHLGVVPLAPLPGQHAFEPPVVLGQEVCPLGDPERLPPGLPRRRAAGKAQQGPGSRRGGRQPHEVPARDPLIPTAGHDACLSFNDRPCRDIGPRQGGPSRIQLVARPQAIAKLPSAARATAAASA